MDSGQHKGSEVQMLLSQAAFDASLHQDSATMSASFCSPFTGILPTNKRVTVCSFCNTLTGNNAVSKLSWSFAALHH